MENKRFWQRRLGLALDRGEDGQHMVEFAFTFMFFTLVLIAFVAFAIVFYMQLSITHAAQQGSRYLAAHPKLPADEVRFDSIDEEATWVITNSVSVVDWRLMEVTFDPPAAERYSGGYVAVNITFDVPLPTVEMPWLNAGSVYLIPPLELSASSRRYLP